MGNNYPVEPDSGFACAVLVSSFLNYMISSGVAIIACGVYLAAMIEGYGCSRAEAYVAGALSMGIVLCSAPVASALIDKTGHRATAIIGAIVSSTGLVLSANVPTLVYHYITFSITGVMYQSSVVVPVHYFVRRRALASSLLFGAAGVSMMVFPNIVRLVIDAYTWRPSFYIMAGIVLNTCVPSMFIRPTSLIKNDNIELRRRIYARHLRVADESNMKVSQPNLSCKEGTEQAISLASRSTLNDGCDQTDQNGQILDIQSESTISVQMFPGLVQNASFWLLLANCFSSQFALTSTSMIIPDMYAVGGIKNWQTSVLFILWGCANTLGRVLSGILWLRLASPLVVYCLANLVWASTLLLFIRNTNFLCLVFANVLTGLGHGSFMTCFSMVTADLVGIRLANRALGFSLFGCGVGGLLAPPILGKLYDATTSYTCSVLLASMTGFVSFADVLVIFYLHKRRNKSLRTA